MPFKPARSASTLISVKGVTKIFHTPAGDFPALQGIDLEISQGELVAVIGRSGSGKSTFINMLSGIDTPSPGKIFIGGKAIHEMSEDKLAAWRGLRLGIIFQFFELLPKELLEEVSQFGKRLDFGPGEAIIRQGELGEAFYVLLDGEARVYIQTAANTELQVNILRPGQYFGEMSLIENNPTTATVLAAPANPVSVVALTPDQFGSLLENSAPFREQLHDVVERYRIRQRIDELAATVGKGGLIEEGESLTFSPGESIFHQGSQDKSLYIVQEGSVDVVFTHPGQPECKLNGLRRGDYFGETCLLGDPRRAAAARVSPDDPASVLRVPETTLERLLKDSGTGIPDAENTLANHEP
jgi:CRP-like cAMP-binding protein